MKRILIALGMALFAFSTIGQENTDFKKFKFGFKVDPNFSWMSPKINEITNEGVLLRAGYGLNADIMFSEKYAFGTGITIMGNGGYLSYLDNETRDNDPTEYIVLRERKYKLKYVEIPLTIKLRTNEVGYITYWGQFGMGLGFTTNAKGDDNIRFISQLNNESGEWDLSEKDDIEDTNSDFSDDIIPVRASLIVGAGVDYSLSGETSVTLGLIYNNGFTNVLKGSGIERDDNGNPIFEPVEGGGLTPKTFDLKSISNHFSISLGILF